MNGTRRFWNKVRAFQKCSFTNTGLLVSSTMQLEKESSLEILLVMCSTTCISFCNWGSKRKWGFPFTLGRAHVVDTHKQAFLLTPCSFSTVCFCELPLPIWSPICNYVSHLLSFLVISSTLIFWSWRLHDEQQTGEKGLNQASTWNYCHTLQGKKS